MPEILTPSVNNVTEAPSPWLTANQAAKRAKVGPACIYAAVRSGDLRAARIGGRRSLRFLAAWVDDWLERTATPIEISRAMPLRVAKASSRA